MTFKIFVWIAPLPNFTYISYLFCLIVNTHWVTDRKNIYIVYYQIPITWVSDITEYR
jgi:hypothetical protein